MIVSEQACKSFNKKERKNSIIKNFTSELLGIVTISCYQCPFMVHYTIQPITLLTRAADAAISIGVKIFLLSSD